MPLLFKVGITENKNRLLGGFCENFGCALCGGVFVSLEAAGADLGALAALEGRPLQISLTAALARRVELGGAGAVRVTAADLRPFAADCTDFGHTWPHATILFILCKDSTLSSQWPY